MQRAIKLMADYECYPLWYSPAYVADIDGGNKIVVRPLEKYSKDDAGCIDSHTLPLTEQTLKRLTKWQDWFDNSLDYEYPPDTVVSEEEAKWFAKEGFFLWRTLIQELPDYQVVYHPKGDKGVMIDPAHPDITYKFDYEAFLQRK